jgi:hypothetical protein
MAHFHELEEPSEIPGYFGEVFNPFGYYNFVVNPDRDYSEKGEHLAVAASPFYAAWAIGTMMSGGGASLGMGMTAGGTGGMFYRMASMGKMKGDIMMMAARQSSRAALFSFRAVRAMSPYAIMAAAAYGLVRGAHEILDGPILGGFHIDLY